jgi:signal transduction histidine kinase
MHTAYFTGAVVIIDQITAVTISLLVHYIAGKKEIIRRLEKTNDQLLKYDTASGFINHEQFHQNLHTQVGSKNPFHLIIIELQPSKNSFNLDQFQSYIESSASLIKEAFPEAHVLARYGRNEFAMLLLKKPHYPVQSMLIRKLNNLQVLLEQTQLYYGISTIDEFTDSQCDHVLIEAEGQLFAMKNRIYSGQELQRVRDEKIIMVGELAAGMAHEIRNPLTSLKGFLQLSKNSNYNIEKWYDLIMNEVLRVSELTSEFLQFSKPHISNYKVLDINECIQRVISLIQSEISLQGHQLIYTPCEQPVYVKMDRDKIVQVLLNIIKNGMEAMETSGQIRIRCKIDEEFVLIEIQDTGIGIEHDKHAHIFDPFYTTKPEGTGLGLSICQKIVHDHDGFIQVVSEAGLGALFTLKIPRVE